MPSGCVYQLGVVVVCEAHSNPIMLQTLGWGAPRVHVYVRVQC
jgi:hypothetical protein